MLHSNDTPDNCQSTRFPVIYSPLSSVCLPGQAPVRGTSKLHSCFPLPSLSWLLSLEEERSPRQHVTE